MRGVQKWSYLTSLTKVLTCNWPEETGDRFDPRPTDFNQGFRNNKLLKWNNFLYQSIRLDERIPKMVLLALSDQVDEVLLA